jgi:hypothetical protein
VLERIGLPGGNEQRICLLFVAQNKADFPFMAGEEKALIVLARFRFPIFSSQIRMVSWEDTRSGLQNNDIASRYYPGLGFLKGVC